MKALSGTNIQCLKALKPFPLTWTRQKAGRGGLPEVVINWRKAGRYTEEAIMTSDDERYNKYQISQAIVSTARRKSGIEKHQLIKQRRAGFTIINQLLYLAEHSEQSRR